MVGRFAMPGAFKHDNLLTFNSHLIKRFSIFFISKIGNHSNNFEERQFSTLQKKLYQIKIIPQLSKLMRRSWSSVLGQPSSQPFRSIWPLYIFQLWIRLEKENFKNITFKSHSSLYSKKNFRPESVLNVMLWWKVYNSQNSVVSRFAMPGAF